MPVELIPHDDPYADIVFADPKPKFVNVPNMLGDGRNYRLREATEGTFLDYQAARMGTAKMEDGVITGMGGGAAADAVLLGGCLFEVKGTEPNVTEAQVGVAFVKRLLSRIAEPLTARLKIISGISDLESAEQLERRIAADRKKLDKLRNDTAGDTGPKGSPIDWPGTCGSAPSAGSRSGNSSDGTSV